MRKRQINTKQSPPTPNQIEPIVTINHRQYLNTIAHDGAAVADGESVPDPQTKSLIRANAPNSPEKQEKGHALVLDREEAPDPSLKYARRPRHKTREDRYEYKGHAEVKKVQKITGRDKRGARRKSGAVLNEEFQAPNVDSQRLTLKQLSGPGFLSKGKSSDPTTRCGVPVLTFSEMAFLNKKRDLDYARFRGLTEQERTRKTSKGSAQDVSEFFAQPAHPELKETSGQRYLDERVRSSHRPSQVVSPLNSAQRQRLSEASRNRYNTSARSILRLRTASSAKTWCPHRHDSRLQHFRVEERLLNRDIPTDGATSHVSWTPSVGHQRAREQSDETSGVAMSLRERRTVNTRSQNSPQAACTLHPRSHVRHVSWAQKHGLPSYRLPLDQAVGTAQAHQRSPKVYYSLDDLKSMAQNLGAVHQAHNHNDLLMRLSQQYGQIYSNYSMLTPQVQQNAREVVPPVDEADMGSVSSRLADNVMSEEQDVHDPIMSRRDSNFYGEHYDHHRPSPPRFAHSARAHGLLPAGQSPSNDPHHSLSDSVLRCPESGVEADQQSKSKRQVLDYRASTDPRTAYNLTNGRAIPAEQQLFTPLEDLYVGEDGLHDFDAKLLQTVHKPTLDLSPHDDSFNSLLSSSSQYARPHTGCDGRHPSDHQVIENHGGKRAPTYETFKQPTFFELEERPRPQLLRPSENEPLDPEPFKGFSRPWILY